MNKSLLITIVIIVAFGGTFLTMTGNSVNENKGIKVTIYKSPTCGCCGGHSAYLDSKGFDVEIITLANVDSTKDKYNIPSSMRSCHTALIEGYFVEGHVPIEAINKLLSERPDIDGIALPNMPAGSPGMPGVKGYDWTIYSITDGQVSEFMRV